MKKYVLASLFIAGCSQVKYMPPQGKDVSPITLVNTISDGASSSLRVFNGPICNQANFVGTAAKVGHKIDVWKSEETTQLESNEKAFLSIGHMMTVPQGTNMLLTYECNKFISFTPKFGESYIVKSISTGIRTCDFELKEVSTSKSPLDLQIIPSNESCIVNTY